MIILFCAVLFLRNFLFALFLIMFVFLFEISVKSIFMSCYSILCSISEKDLLFALSNFQFRSTNFSNVCIQHVRMNLTNLISRNMISSVNQIQLKISDQL